MTSMIGIGAGLDKRAVRVLGWKYSLHCIEEKCYMLSAKDSNNVGRYFLFRDEKGPPPSPPLLSPFISGVAVGPSRFCWVAARTQRKNGDLIRGRQDSTTTNHFKYNV